MGVRGEGGGRVRVRVYPYGDVQLGHRHERFHLVGELRVGHLGRGRGRVGIGVRVGARVGELRVEMPSNPNPNP